MAAGSASEVTTALRIAVAKRYISPVEFAEIDAVLDRIRAMLYRLTKSTDQPVSRDRAGEPQMAIMRTLGHVGPSSAISET